MPRNTACMDKQTLQVHIILLSKMRHESHASVGLRRLHRMCEVLVHGHFDLNSASV